MSTADFKAHQADIQGATTNLPIMLNNKASAAAPKLTEDDDNVEMKDMLPGKPVGQADVDIMQLARLGDIPAIQRLYDEGKFEPTYCDVEGITPLHVCILNQCIRGGY
jgi:hypothetical protein